MKIKLIIAIVIALLFSKFVIWFFSSSSGSDDIKGNSSNSNNKKKNSSVKWYVDHTQTITFDGRDSTFYLPSGWNIGFEGATQPYDVVNNAGDSAHGEKGQDVSDQLPNKDKDKRNCTLRFKSSNGLMDTLTINFFTPAEK